VKINQFRIGILSLVVSLCAVQAQEAAPASPPPAPAAAPAPPAKIPLIGGNKAALLGNVGDSPNVVVAAALDGGWLVGGGLSLTINPNGLPTPTGPSTAKVASALIAYGSYQIHNVFPFSCGPEVTLAVPVAPNNVGDVVQFIPGFNFWYAPWNAPVAIGSAVGARFTFVKGASPVFDTVTFGIRFGYIFN
jgi:hypothetical protein